MYKAIAIRFLKGFVAAGIASTVTLLAAGITVHTIADLKTFAISLVTAFVAGGLLGIEKTISWQDVPQA